MDSVKSVHANNAESLRFDVTGFEPCVFNLVIAPTSEPGKDISTDDFVERFTVSNQRLKLWTISTWPVLPSNESTRVKSLFHRNEVCSINVVVSIVGTSKIGIEHALGTRLYNPQNILYFVRGGYTKDFYGRFPSFNSRVICDVVLIQLTRNDLRVLFSDLWCESCFGVKTINLYHPLPVSYRKLMHVRLFSAEVKRRFMVSETALLTQAYWFNLSSKDVIPCQHLYKKRWSTKPHVIGCLPRHILIENVAAKLNSSLDYHPTHLTMDAITSERGLRKPYSAIVIAAYMDWIQFEGSLSHEHLLKQVLRGYKESVFMYCKETLEREGFNFLFWTIPFDTWSWILIGASTLAITLILRGQWFPVFAILMRQDCRVLEGRHKLLLIVFILATIIFTYGYEGIISSLLIVTPPEILYHHLNDLLTNKKYKIRADKYSLWMCNRLLIRENITFNSEFDIDFVTGNRPIETEYSRLAQCNITTLIHTEATMAFKLFVNILENDQVSCNHVKEPRFRFVTLHQFFGLNSPRFTQIEEMLVHSGIWTHYYDYEKYIQDLPLLRKRDRMEYESTLPMRFTMMDWYILSIFVAWAVLLILTFIVVLGEIMYSHRKLHIWKYYFEFASDSDNTKHIYTSSFPTNSNFKVLD